LRCAHLVSIWLGYFSRFILECNWSYMNWIFIKFSRIKISLSTTPHTRNPPKCIKKKVIQITLRLNVHNNFKDFGSYFAVVTLHCDIKYYLTQMRCIKRINLLQSVYTTIKTQIGKRATNFWWQKGNRSHTESILLDDIAELLSEIWHSLLTYYTRRLTAETKQSLCVAIWQQIGDRKRAVLAV
jgi:hypothetical protein